LPTALLLAQDRRVVGVDVDASVVDTLEGGALPFSEPGLPDLLEATGDRFSAQTTVPADADTYVVATPTPLEEVTGVADMQYVREAVETVASRLDPDDLVVLESTVPPGTSSRLVVPLLEESGLEAGEFNYAYCPERAIPGRTVREMVENDRIVGCLDAESQAAVHDLYGYVEGELHATDPTTAEFVKLMENTYRDVNIALANEFATLSEAGGIDGREAIDLANNHPRVDILEPGPGVGGHCIPIDPQFLTQSSTDSRLISVARDINNAMALRTVNHVRELTTAVPDAKLTVLGAAYKGDVADTRRTPTRRVVRLAENEGFDVQVTDPHVEEFERPVDDFGEATDGSDCLVLVTDHEAYDTLDPESLATRMRRPALVDTRGLVDPERWEAAGFAVRRLGDGTRGSSATIGGGR
jgi:UDP-N-acetyl-D-mannosaminuronic acid dehydrogenase